MCGKLEWNEDFKIYSMLNPMYTMPYAEFKPGIKRVYSKFKGVSDKMLNTTIMDTFRETNVIETIPAEVIEHYHLLRRSESLRKLHYPTDLPSVSKSIQRQLFEDILYFACSLEKNNRKISDGSQYNLRTMNLYHKLSESLPYNLTEDQKRVTEEILNDMKNGRRINALIQGDVGCGKSIVGFILMLAMAESTYQSVIMAPTLVLAEQHYTELKSYADRFGFNVAFIGGTQTAKEKRKLLSKIESGEIQLIVGTHAVLSDKVKFKNLALCVIDEEHRFGVGQRRTLAEKARSGVHTVSFSATPIPRTMMTSVFGKTKVYEIKSMPKGRSPIKTAICRTDKSAIEFLRKQIAEGSQGYVVCPLIDSDIDDCKLRTVKEVAKEYTDTLGVPVGIVTGKQTKKETQETLEAFKRGDLKVLVATTVVEVGVNVPNATVIIIEDAWMFGLAQLHQLRGRVGRGEKQGYCILVNSKPDENERLNIMTQTTDGFKIAEADCTIRGAGNLLGYEQNGNNRFLIESLQFPKMFSIAKDIAEKMVDDGSCDILINEMEARSEKIYVNYNKIKIFA